jgi:membrane associated rhomboid family serine protease
VRCATIPGMDQPPGGTGSALDESEETYCYGHPNTPTKLRCSRCDRPICGRCAIPASVGQHCPECVAEARRSTPNVRTALAKQAPGVMAILGINVVVFVFQQLVPDLTNRFAMNPIAIASGEWWRLFTPMIVHSPDFAFHIVMNSLVLFIFGPVVERAFGTMRFVVMYVIAGFVGSVASYNFSEPFVRGVGASGAIFGMAGVLLVYLFNRRQSSFVYGEMRNVMFFIGINLVIGFSISGIDYWAHIGGLLGGMALGFGFDNEGRSVEPVPVQIATSVAVFAVGLGVALYRTSDLGGSLFG